MMSGWLSVMAAAGAMAFGGAGLAETRTYEVEVVVTWSTTTHPGAFPNAAHLSHFGGAVHSDAVHFWRVGEVATPGVKRMAETGSLADWDDELLTAVGAGTASSAILERYWFCPGETVHPSCGTPVFEIEVSDAFPLVTLASMLGPSPDWFVGLDSEDLREGAGWASERVYEMNPYDGGTRSNNATFDLFGPLNDPPEGISVITTESGQAVGPDSLGQIIFRLVIPECAADFDVDGVIGAADLATLLAAWGMSGETDLNGDGVTDAGDLAVLLAGWGVCG